MTTRRGDMGMERERPRGRAAPLEPHPGRAAPLEPHPVRVALLELIRRDGVVTATGAARELGGSTGLYSFHLRQLARHGVLEEAPAPRGRVRPWRLARPGTAGPPGEQPAEQPGEQQLRPVSDAQLSAVARGLEDEGYRRWLEHRVAAPGRWRRDEAFSQVLYLTPDEMAGLAEVIRALIAQYRHREASPAARPPEAAPVAIVARLFPLLEPGAGPALG
ncbi:MAG TPA: helix-turn-helix domain-containing protein [Streptosporangiaceae bacterium]|nr:helix-turn-helix domain-containing protein [Streptosporangiaceae bacterium]